METIVNGIRRPLPPQRPRDTAPIKFRLRRPTAPVFFTCYAIVWLVGAVVVYQQAKHLTFLSVSMWNMLFVCINMVGVVIAAATGWAPWRDSHS